MEYLKAANHRQVLGYGSPLPLLNRQPTHEKRQRAGAVQDATAQNREDFGSEDDLPPEPTFAERVRVMCRHLDLMIEVFGEEQGCRMFRKVAPWYAKRFGPCHDFNKRVVQVSTRAGFHEVLGNYTRWRQQFLDENGELQPRFRPPPLVASFMRESETASTTREHIPVPKGPVEVW